MARTPKTTEVIDLTDKQIDTGKMTNAMGAMRSQELAVIEADAQLNTRVRAVAEMVGYVLPGEAVDADLIQRDISANMRRSIEACLEVGRGLVVLREACPHGQFTARLDVLGIEARVAQRFMSSARRFSNAASTPLLKAIGNQTKLFEMLVLDDEEIEELALTGQTGELSLDDVAVMSVKELRSALRELRAEHDSAEQVRGDLRKKIDKLERDSKRIKTEGPDEALIALSKEAQGHASDALGAIRGAVSDSLRALAKHYIEHGGEPILLTMAGMVGQLQAELNAIRADLHIPDISTAADVKLAGEVAQWAGTPKAA
ncbi:hypothetical protein ACVC7V_17410 [Hydrogenophaga sp. A37]|uniref:hypothetical protein n=1 Tax=Hydrogenophaga sp. A37 TaxID=1945864 RepID=UPI00098423C2|nr:hypothetical protein [Hydrogenophaga sp. A37]OOG79187.1 hypothetical protein B0E41_25535 [Hydrogenophaga sp. A37]